MINRTGLFILLPIFPFLSYINQFSSSRSLKIKQEIKTSHNLSQWITNSFDLRGQKGSPGYFKQNGGLGLGSQTLR